MSQIFRLFESAKFEANTSVSFSGDSHHIVSRVLRKKEGDTLELLNGEGSVAKAKISKIDKKILHLHIDSVKTWTRPTPAISLYVGSLKGDKLTWIAQKATELGVDEIGIFISDHSVAIKSEGIVDKVSKTIVEALRQSGNPFLPRLRLYKQLDHVTKVESSNHWEIILDEKEHEPFSKMILLGKPAGISLFIGPEGGFSENERHFFRERGCHSLRIAPYTLRADTAAIAAVSMCRAAFS